MARQKTQHPTGRRYQLMPRPTLLDYPDNRRQNYCNAACITHRHQYHTWPIAGACCLLAWSHTTNPQQTGYTNRRCVHAHCYPALCPHLPEWHASANGVASSVVPAHQRLDDQQKSVARRSGLTPCPKCVNHQ